MIKKLGSSSYIDYSVHGLGAEVNYDDLSFEGKSKKNIDDFFKPSVSEIERALDLKTTIDDSSEYTVLQLGYNKENWSKLLSGIEDKKSEIGTSTNLFSTELINHILDNAHLIGIYTEDPDDEINAVSIPEYGWLDEYSPFEGMDEQDYTYVFIDCYSIFNNGETNGRDQKVKLPYKGEIIEMTPAEIACRMCYVARSANDPLYYKCSVIKYDSEIIRENDRKDNTQLSDEEKEALYYSQFFEKKAEDLQKETGLQVSPNSEYGTNKLNVTINEKLWQIIVSELEPEKEEIGDDFSVFKNLFFDNLLDKMNLKGIVSDSDKNGSAIICSLFSELSTYQGQFLDYDPFKDNKSLNVTVCFGENTDQEILVGDKSIIAREAAYRAYYVVKTYSNADFFSSVDYVTTLYPTDILKGDIDNNNRVDITDLTELSLALIGDKELTAEQMKVADVDNDGAVTLADLARLRQYLSKKIYSLG